MTVNVRGALGFLAASCCWRSAKSSSPAANDSPSRPARTTRVIFLSSSTTSSLDRRRRRRRVAPRRHDRAVVVARDAVAVHRRFVDAVVAAVTRGRAAEVVRRISLAGRVSQTGPSPGVSCATDILAPGRHRTILRAGWTTASDRIVAAPILFALPQIQTACWARAQR